MTLFALTILISLLAHIRLSRKPKNFSYEYYVAHGKVTIKSLYNGRDYVKLIHDRSEDSYGVFSSVDGVVYWQWSKNKGLMTIEFRKECRRMYNKDRVRVGVTV